MYRIFIYCLGIFTATAFYLSVQPVQSHASANCLPLYGGGITDKQYCQNPTPNPAAVKGSATTGQNTQQTSGQTVYPSSNSTATPDTGPADWVLPALLLTGGFGILLIKKTEKFS